MSSKSLNHQSDDIQVFPNGNQPANVPRDQYTTQEIMEMGGRKPPANTLEMQPQQPLVLSNDEFGGTTVVERPPIEPKIHKAPPKQAQQTGCTIN
jgi:hypothetical protein